MVAQNDPLKKPLAETFADYHDRHLQEKIFVHTDRTAYLTGEHIWLKLYYVDGTDHRPLNMSTVAYVELIDKNGEPVIQLKVELEDDGSASGNIFLPISLYRIASAM